MMALLAALIVLLCAFVVQPVKLPMATGLKPALAVALGHFLLGLLCIVSQRNILRQIFGYCLMENGSHLVLALLAWRSTGTGGNRYRYRRHLRRHCDGVTGKKNMAYPRHAGREQLDRAEGIMR
ncbi:hydrogenase-4 component E [Escherichia coli]|uniref:Hydrogenase-4 component E n=1 Tax=Escherichia coli TaxID=562 RepID=A0A2X3K8E3_ECOLX|nr:hydrogenase-4 component E [Escherichia coli]